MNNKSLDEKWLDAQAHPENYSDEELDELLFSQAEDIGLLKRAFAYEEAKKKTIVVSTQERHSWMKIAATFVGLLMLSGLSFAAYHIASQHTRNKEVVAAADSLETQKATKKTAADQDWAKIEPTEHAPVVFEDAELATILKYIAEKANVKVEYRHPSAAHIRFYLQWDSKDSLQDIIDKINHFEKVHVSFDEEVQLLIVE